MAKKKTHKKRKSTKSSRQFTAAKPSAVETTEAVEPNTTARPALTVSKSVPKATPEVDPKIAYVKHDIAQIGFLVSLFVLLEIALWYSFNHTGLGTYIYHLVKI